MSNVRSLGRVAASCRVALLGGLFFFSAPAWAQISLVHATSCGAATFPATPCTIPATGGGKLLVVAWSAAYGNTPTTTSITDNAGNSYAQAGSARAVDAAAGQMVDIWYAKNSKSGATSLTITPSASVTGAAMIWEFSGADLTAPLDQTLVLNSQAATATPSSGSITAGLLGEAIVSVMVPVGSVTGIQTGNAFVSDSLMFGVGWAHLLAPSAGTYTAQWNTSVGGYASSTISFKAASSGSALNACDLSGDGLVNVLDVNRAVNMTLGLSPCTANINGAGICSVVTVQRVVNASLSGGPCVVDGAPVIPVTSHSVTLTWVASTSSNVAGYNIYRGTTSGGPYASKVNSSLATGLGYTDPAVLAGQTYFYVATSVDTSGNESAPSTQVAAVIPTP